MLNVEKLWVNFELQRVSKGQLINASQVIDIESLQWLKTLGNNNPVMMYTAPCVRMSSTLTVNLVVELAMAVVFQKMKIQIVYFFP